MVDPFSFRIAFLNLSVPVSSSINWVPMEIASSGWLSDMVMDQDPFLNSLSYSLDGHNLDFNSFPSESFSSIPYLQPSNNFHNPPEIPASSSYDERPARQLKRDVSTPLHKTSPSFSSSPQIISFGKTSSSSSSASSDYASIMPNNEEMTKKDFSYLASQEEEGSYWIAANHPQLFNAQGASHSKNRTRTHLHAREHVIAERKRREKLSQRLIALSAMIPGLKKTDRASILGDAIKYLKQLQERVKALEEEVSKKAVESVVLVKKSQVPADEDATSSVENSHSNQYNQQNLPKIEARVSGKLVLIRIHCEKRKGCVSKIHDEIEKLNSLTVLNSSVLPFGSCMLDITIMAQMEVEFNVRFEDFVKNLRRSL